MSKLTLVDWAQAPKGTTHCHVNEDMTIDWYKYDTGLWYESKCTGTRLFVKTYQWNLVTLIDDAIRYMLPYPRVIRQV